MIQYYIVWKNNRQVHVFHCGNNPALAKQKAMELAQKGNEVDFGGYSVEEFNHSGVGVLIKLD